MMIMIMIMMMVIVMMIVMMMMMVMMVVVVVMVVMMVDMGEETSRRRGRDGDFVGFAGCNVKNNQDSNGAQHEGI